MFNTRAQSSFPLSKVIFALCANRTHFREGGGQNRSDHHEDEGSDSTGHGIRPRGSWARIRKDAVKDGNLELTQDLDRLVALVIVSREGNPCWQMIPYVEVKELRKSVKDYRHSSRKVQLSSPWKYVGFLITAKNITPQTVQINDDPWTLRDLQQLCGVITWIQPLLGLTTEDLSPLFNLLKGNSDLVSPCALTNDTHTTLRKVSLAISSRQAHRIDKPLPFQFAVLGKPSQTRDMEMGLLTKIIMWMVIAHFVNGWIIQKPKQNIWVTLMKTINQDNFCMAMGGVEDLLSTCLVGVPFSPKDYPYAGKKPNPVDMWDEWTWILPHAAQEPQ
ncbi:Endogenous retrovirus group K member 8 Pol protein [Lonchura striata]|uniref:Endogenous retrovirus group K member 8 Pol protein n=1 Tax=Lonchura striata TaxID=40157 RepID=A0A218UF23_9PASE|nr:Endogenous retrovirus group K member 8 Pol protein [Lonchura striata domestica]